MTPKMRNALKYLIAAIDDVGMEYPEAHWCAIDHCGLTVKEGEALQRAYDDCEGTLAGINTRP